MPVTYRAGYFALALSGLFATLPAVAHRSGGAK